MFVLSVIVYVYVCNLMYYTNIHIICTNVYYIYLRYAIAGWDEALLTDMKVGGKRKVIIPPSLGYGKRGAGGVIPPDATLYFTMELVGIGAR